MYSIEAKIADKVQKVKKKRRNSHWYDEGAWTTNVL